MAEKVYCSLLALLRRCKSTNAHSDAQIGNQNIRQSMTVRYGQQFAGQFPVETFYAQYACWCMPVQRIEQSLRSE